MKKSIAMLALASAISGPASAGFVGTTMDLNISTTGTVQSTWADPIPTTITEPGIEFQFCIGPNSDNCNTTGMYGMVDVHDNWLGIFFTGSTFASNGTFSLELTGFAPNITNHIFLHDSNPTFNGTFALTGITANSLIFTATQIAPDAGFSASGAYYNYFIPAPAAFTLFAAGFAAMRLTRRRDPVIA